MATQTQVHATGCPKVPRASSSALGPVQSALLCQRPILKAGCGARLPQPAMPGRAWRPWAHQAPGGCSRWTKGTQPGSGSGSWSGRAPGRPPHQFPPALAQLAAPGPAQKWLPPGCPALARWAAAARAPAAATRAPACVWGLHSSRQPGAQPPRGSRVPPGLRAPASTLRSRSCAGARRPAWRDPEKTSSGWQCCSTDATCPAPLRSSLRPSCRKKRSVSLCGTVQHSALQHGRSPAWPLRLAARADNQGVSRTVRAHIACPLHAPLGLPWAPTHSAREVPQLTAALEGTCS